MSGTLFLLAAAQMAVPVAPPGPAVAPALACIDQAIAGGDPAPVNAALDAYLAQPEPQRDAASQAAVGNLLSGAATDLARCNTSFPVLAAHPRPVGSYAIARVMNRAATAVAQSRRFDPETVRRIYRTLPPATAAALIHGATPADAEAFATLLAAAGQPNRGFADRALPILLVATDRALADQAAEIAAP